MKVSIITVNLNNKAGLEKTMHSIISQTSKDYEWIVIDGGSTDGSKELLEQNTKHIAYWVSEPDKGAYNAMNKGIAVAKGEYLQFLNSGDYLAEGGVVERFCALQTTEDVVYGDTISVNTEGRKIGRRVEADIMRLSCFWNHSPIHQSIFFSKRCFETYRYNETYRIMADRELLMHLICDNFSFRKWNEFIACYEIGGLSATTKTNNEFADIVGEVLPLGIRADYEEILQFRDVDLAIMIKSIIRSNSFIRNLARVCLYPIYLFCKK